MLACLRLVLESVFIMDVTVDSDKEWELFFLFYCIVNVKTGVSMRKKNDFVEELYERKFYQMC